MTKKFSYRSVLVRAAVILPLAFGASACSTIADLDPTGLLSDDDSTTADSQFPATPTTQPSDADQGTTPDLAGLPARPDAPSAAAQQQTAQSLAADGAQVRYSADALRGGTEAAAPPPGAAATPTQTAAADAADLPPTADAVPTAEATPAAEAPLAAEPPGVPAAVPAQPSAPVSAAPVQTASVPPPAMSSPPPGAEPAVPADTPVRGGMASAVMSDASLGFKPSSAPPLSPSIGQWVPSPIVAHYRQTASNAGISQAMSPAVPAQGARGMGGPDMSGAVVANLDAISAPGGMTVMNGGVPPTAVVYFPGDGVTLSAAARSQIRGAATAFKADGGQGTIRVVGHASSRTVNMPVEKHLETIFDKSQKRANAVAQELIHDGVPAAQVLVEAVGDSQPVYFESMPKGEDGNRRAEIFVQG